MVLLLLTSGQLMIGRYYDCRLELSSYDFLVQLRFYLGSKNFVLRRSTLIIQLRNIYWDCGDQILFLYWPVLAESNYRCLRFVAAEYILMYIIVISAFKEEIQAVYIDTLPRRDLSEFTSCK